MKRIAVALALVLAIGGLALSAETTVLKVKVQTANIRTQPDLNAAVIKQVKMGTLFESSQTAGDWYEISVTNDLGVTLTAYVHANVVDVISGPRPRRPAGSPARRSARPGPRPDAVLRAAAGAGDNLSRRFQDHGRLRDGQPDLFRGPRRGIQ